MTREDLVATNGKIIREVMENVVAHSPDAIVILVTNPLDTMVYLAIASEYVDQEFERALADGGVV